MSGRYRKSKLSASVQLVKMRKALKAAKAAKPRARSSIPKGMRRSVTKSEPPWHKGLASAAGETIGSFFGGPVGGRIGRSAGDLFSRITGFGDYKIQENSLVGMGVDPPAFKGDGRGTIIRHREFIADVSGTSDFTINSYPLNPGMSDAFPWASQVAQDFEQYRIRGLVFEYKTTSATAIVSGTNSAMGTVLMATEYDSQSAEFASKAEMANHEFCTSSVPSASFLHPVECKPSSTSISTLYVRTGAVPSGADIRMYDLGRFSIATVGMQSTNVIGELWCTFEIELFKPRLFSALDHDYLIDHYQLPIATVSSTNYLGTTFPGPVATSNLGSSISATNVLHLPDTMDGQPYRILLYYYVLGSNTVLTNGMSLTGSSGVNAITILSQDTANRLTNTATATANIQFFYGFWDIEAGVADPTLTWSAGTVPTSPTQAEIFVIKTCPLLETVTKRSALAKRLALAKSVSESKEEKKELEPDSDPEDEEILAAIAAVKAAKKTKAAALLEAPASSRPDPDRSKSVSKK